MCKEDTCKNKGTCIESWHTYECRCPAGYGGKDCSQGEYNNMNSSEAWKGPSNCERNYDTEHEFVESKKRCNGFSNLHPPLAFLSSHVDEIYGICPMRIELHMYIVNISCIYVESKDNIQL